MVCNVNETEKLGIVGLKMKIVINKNYNDNPNKYI